LNLNTMIQNAIPQIPAGERGTYNSGDYDSSGNFDFAWYDSTARMLLYSSQTPDGTWAPTTAIYPGTADGGKYLSLAIDSNGQPGVSFFDAAVTGVRYAHLSGGVWTTQAVDITSGVIVGHYTSLAFNSSNAAAIAYYDTTNGHPKYAKQASGSWNVST